MPANDFWECFILEQLQPFGERGGDVRAGIVASAAFNSQRINARDKVFTPMDFIRYLWDAPQTNQPQTAEQQLHQMLLLQKLQDERMIKAHG